MEIWLEDFWFHSDSNDNFIYTPFWVRKYVIQILLNLEINSLFFSQYPRLQFYPTESNTNSAARQ